MKKRRVAILVPAHNEEELLAETLASLLLLVPSEDIYVVNDGSKDATESIARQFTKNVLTLSTNYGKAGAINAGIVNFKLTDRYEYIMPIDADSLVSPNFLKNSLTHFEADTKGAIAAIVGKVVGRNTRWITTYRLWEYEIAQTVHKAAQSVLGAIIVCPGPSTIYRTRVFKKLMFSTETVTEDMDLTFSIHRKNIGKIIYTPAAFVVTQDPKTLKEFIKQINRWYTGFWQCTVKHKIPWGGQMLDLEVALLATEGLFNGLLVLSLLILIPITLTLRPTLLLIPFLTDLVLFQLTTTTYVALKHKTLGIYRFLPHFYLVRLLSCFVFLVSFARVVFALDLRMKKVWATARYKLKKEELWPNPSL